MVKSDRVDPAADLVPGGNGVFAYSSGGVPVFVTRREQQADMMEINTPETMQAAVLYQTGKPDKLIVAEVDVPEIEEGEVLIQVCAFGLNRSEMFTRQGKLNDLFNFTVKEILTVIVFDQVIHLVFNYLEFLVLNVLEQFINQENLISNMEIK